MYDELLASVASSLVLGKLLAFSLLILGAYMMDLGAGTPSMRYEVMRVPIATLSDIMHLLSISGGAQVLRFMSCYHCALPLALFCIILQLNASIVGRWLRDRHVLLCQVLPDSAGVAGFRPCLAADWIFSRLFDHPLRCSLYNRGPLSVAKLGVRCTVFYRLCTTLGEHAKHPLT